MTLAYLLSQFFIVLTYFFLMLSYNSKKRKKILVFSTASVLFNAISYAFVGAWPGVAMCVVALARNFYSAWDVKRNGLRKKVEARDYFVLVMTMVATVAAMFMTHPNAASLLPLVGTMIYTYSIWQKNPTVYKFLGIPTCASYLMYHFYLRSFFGTVLELALLIFAIYSYVSTTQKESKRAELE